MEKANKFNEFSILRALGALAVITIHVTSVYGEFNSTSVSYLLFGIVNKFCNFAVPIFLFLSAALLTKNYLSKDNFKILDFYKKRFLKLVPVYLIYVAIYYFYLRYNNIFLLHPIKEPAKFFTSYILQGEIFYHLYFMVIIFQLYILFPIIYWLTKKLKMIKLHPILSFLICFFVILLLQFGAQKINKYYIYPYYQNTARLLIPYIMPIGLGVWIGANYNSFINSKVIKILAFLVASISGYFFIRYSIYPTIQLNSLVYPIYTSSISIVLLMLSTVILNKTKVLKNILNEISKFSFTIYLIHPLFLDIFIRNFTITNAPFLNNLGYATIKFITILVASYIVALLISLVKKGIYKLFTKATQSQISS